MCVVKAMVFPILNVWMWKLTHEEGRATKNWCFWIVLLEKTLENLLDHKEIKLVNPKGNQAWIFTGRTDAEAPMATWCEQSTHWRRPWCWERLKGKKRKGWQKMKWLDSITDSVDMNLSKLCKIVEDRGAWGATVHEVTKSQIQLSEWTTAN